LRALSKIGGNAGPRGFAAQNIELACKARPGRPRAAPGGTAAQLFDWRQRRRAPSLKKGALCAPGRPIV